MFTNFPSDRQDILQVCTAVFPWRRAHRNEGRFRVLNGLLQRSREMQAIGCHIALDNLFQSRLVDGKNAFVEIGNFFNVDIYTGNVHANIREAGSCHKADIACSYNSDFHMW